MSAEKLEELTLLLEDDAKAANKFILEDRLKVLGKRRRFLDADEQDTTNKLRRIGDVKSPFGPYRNDKDEPGFVAPADEDAKTNTVFDLAQHARVLIHDALKTLKPGDVVFYVTRFGESHLVSTAKVLCADQMSGYFIILGATASEKELSLTFSDNDYEDGEVARYPMLPAQVEGVADVKRLYQVMFPDCRLVYK